MHFNWTELGSDAVTILILVVLEGLLSGDNALVLAVIVQPLPQAEQRKALQYGIIGAFVLRIIATLAAVVLKQMSWVALLGGLYLLYLPLKHFTQRSEDTQEVDPNAGRVLGLSLFWSVVVKADLVDLVFAVDSILAAVAMTQKTWVIITGGLLGILMMRMLTVQVLDLVRRYPKLIDGAYVVVLWIGVKLIWEFFHKYHLLPALPQWFSLGMVVVLFTAAFLYARADARSQAARRKRRRERRAAMRAERLFGPAPAAREPRPETPPDSRALPPREEHARPEPHAEP